MKNEKRQERTNLQQLTLGITCWMSSDFKKSDGEYRLSTGQTLFYSCHPEIQAGGCGVGLHPDRNPVSGIIISARDRSNTRSLFLVFIGSFRIPLPGEDGRRVLMLRLNFDFLVDSSGGAAQFKIVVKSYVSHLPWVAPQRGRSTLKHKIKEPGLDGLLWKADPDLAAQHLWSLLQLVWDSESITSKERQSETMARAFIWACQAFLS